MARRNPMRDEIAIVGLGSTDFVRDALGRSAASLAAEACTAAIRDAGVEKGDIDGVVGALDHNGPALVHVLPDDHGDVFLKRHGAGGDLPQCGHGRFIVAFDNRLTAPGQLPGPAGRYTMVLARNAETVQSVLEMSDSDVRELLQSLLGFRLGRIRRVGQRLMYQWYSLKDEGG